MNARTRQLLVALILFVCGGASCPRSRQVTNDFAPAVLESTATLADVIRAVNTNSARIQQLESQGATLTIEGLPTLDASYAIDRPRRMRLRAESGMLGPVLDIGSNDQIYWIWAKDSEQPGVYWGRHDEFDQSAAKDLLPIPPDWLIEAIGVVQLDPTAEHEGPVPVRPGQLQIRSHLQTPQGPITKLTVVDDQRGWVMEQHLFDAQQRSIASAVASGFQFDQVTGTSLPRYVDIRVPAAQLKFTLETQRHVINALSGDPNQLWNVPQMKNVPMVDLSDPQINDLLSAPWLSARRPRRMANRPSADQRSWGWPRLPSYFDRLR